MCLRRCRRAAHQAWQASQTGVETPTTLICSCDATRGRRAAGTAIDKDTILSIPCDVLVPAAIGGVITADSAPTIQARYVVEAANGPTDPGGDAVLRERGIVVLPDIYTNGGVLLQSQCDACMSLFPVQSGVLQCC